MSVRVRPRGIGQVGFDIELGSVKLSRTCVTPWHIRSILFALHTALNEIYVSLDERQLIAFALILDKLDILYFTIEITYKQIINSILSIYLELKIDVIVFVSLLPSFQSE